MYSPRKVRTWIVDFLLRENGETKALCIVMKAYAAGHACCDATKAIQLRHPRMPYFIHGVGLAADESIPEGHVFEDPVGWDDDDGEFDWT